MTDELDIFSDVPPHLAGSENALVLTVRGGEDRIFVEDGTICTSRAGHVRSHGKSLGIVIVGAAEHTSRSYYVGESLQCYSADGVTPDVQEPQAPGCRGCPQNQIGSRITNGRKAKACGYFHRFAVVLADEMQDCVYSLDVRTTSLFGTGKPADNLFSMKGYTELLQRKGVGVEKLVTRIVLDEDVSYTKLLFQPARFVTADEQHAIRALVGSEEVEARLVVHFDDVLPPQDSAPSTGLFFPT